MGGSGASIEESVDDGIVGSVVLAVVVGLLSLMRGGAAAEATSAAVELELGAAVGCSDSCVSSRIEELNTGVRTGEGS